MTPPKDLDLVAEVGRIIEKLARDPIVEVEGETITVSFPVSACRASYYRQAGEPHLSAGAVVHDPRAATLALRSIFLACAFRAANDEARRLGWIV